MNVILIKRRKVIHVGIPIRSDDKIYIISTCRRDWYCDDKIEGGDSSGATCKRCIKYVKEAETNEDGIVNLKPIKSRHRRKVNG